jgi:hypothetical protein
MAKGTHAAPSRIRPRALLGPIRPGWEQVPGTDPYGLRAKRPANLGLPDDPTVAMPDGETALASAPDPWTVLPEEAGVRAPSPEAALVRAPEPALVRTFVGLAELGAVALAAVWLAVAAFARPATGDELHRVARAVARARPDLAAPAGSLPQRTFDAVLAGWITLTGALNRHSTALGAIRELMFVATVLIVLLVWLLTLRLRLAEPARIAAVLTVGAAAPLIDGAVRPGPLAAAFVVLATVLVAGEHVGTPLRLTALVVVLGAVVVLPAALPALLAAFAVLAAQGDIPSRTDSESVLAATGRWLLAILSGVGACAGALAVGRHPATLDGWLGPTAAVPTPDPNRAQWTVAIVAVALTGLGVARRWLRAPAAAAALLLVTALLAAPPLRPELLAVSVPVVAVVAAGCADDVTTRWRAAIRWVAWPIALRTVTATVVALALAGAAVAVASRAPAAPEPPRTREAAAWLGSEIPEEVPLAVDDAVWPDLVRAGIAVRRMTTGGAAPASSATLDAIKESSSTRWRIGAGPAPGGWVGCATFGSGRGEVTIAWRAGAAPFTDQARQTVLGAALAENPQLRLAPAAAAALRSGNVDIRIVLVLSELAGKNGLEIGEFPLVPGEQIGNPPLRRVLITAVDGRPASDPGAVDLIQHWLDRQLDQYRPRAVELTSAGLLVRYPMADPSNI